MDGMDQGHNTLRPHKFVGLKLCDFKARFKTALKVLSREGHEHGRGHGHGHRQLTVAQNKLVQQSLSH
jgi:hypothetical protein